MARMPVRMLVVVALVAIWAVGGSVALAFAHCASMAAPCEAPCGTTATLEDPASDLVSTPPVRVEPQSGLRQPTMASRQLDPVPRPFRLSA